MDKVNKNYQGMPAAVHSARKPAALCLIFVRDGRPFVPVTDGWTFNINLKKAFERTRSFLRNLYTARPIIYTYFIRFLDNLKKGRQTKMDGLYLSVINGCLALTGLMVKLLNA